uniref:Uncharacterized protein n=1 Tax=Anguilla anguilla TaxID=7936 RepID=A0A0E9VFB5_ANGAN
MSITKGALTNQLGLATQQPNYT